MSINSQAEVQLNNHGIQLCGPCQKPGTCLSSTWEKCSTVVLDYLQLSLGLSDHLVHPAPLPRSVLHTDSAWECTCPRRCFGRAAQMSYSTLMKMWLGRRRDVELQIPSYQRRLHFNTAFQYKLEAVNPQITCPDRGCGAPRSPGRWMWASAMKGS